MRAPTTANTLITMSHTLRPESARTWSTATTVRAEHDHDRARTRASTSFTSTGRAKPEEPLNIGGDEQPAHDQPEGDPDEG